MGWVMRDCFICPLGKVISCVLVSWGSHQQYCKWGCQLNPSLVWLGSAGRLGAGKDRDHLVKTGRDTADGGLYSLGRELLWSGQMHLFPHLFKSLLALFGSSCKHTLTLHRTFV